MHDVEIHSMYLDGPFIIYSPSLDSLIMNTSQLLLIWLQPVPRSV